MKRKLFSAILFGALLVASTSGLTSCKDYDDDITNLQSQIDKLATKEELSAKAGELANTISTAQQAANAAKETADKALAAAQGASTDAKAAADAAKAAQAKADEVAGDLKDAVAAAATQIQEAVKDLATKQEVADAVKEVADKYDAQAKELKALSDRLAKVEAKLGMGEGGEDIDLTEIQKEIEAIQKDLEAIIGKVADMVTSVELVYSSWANGYNNGENDLVFKLVTEKKNDSFGKDVADKVLTTTKDNTKFYGDEVIIRVNPVDAEISASDVSLINSKGEELTGLVEATKVERYSDKDYLTRAAGANTGLWKVTFAPKEGQDADDLEEKFAVDSKKIVYGVAVKSAINDTISANRRVVSAYDVTLALGEYKVTISDVNGHSNDASVPSEVNGITVKTSTTDKAVKTIHNRYGQNGGVELIWKSNTPQTANDYNYNTNTGAKTTVGDDRWTKNDRVVARVGEDIEIKFAKDIKGFYVMLDYGFVETASAPSELNAWNSYKYENVGKTGVAAKMFEGNKGTIKVSSLSGEATGDEIGFRIFAMNLDGTLVDPDGVAFYVTVGEVAGDDIVLTAQDILVTKAEDGQGFDTTLGVGDNVVAGNLSAEVALPKDAFKGYSNGDITCVNVANGDDKPKADTYQVLYKVGDNWKKNFDADAKAVKVQILKATKFVDGATYKITLPLQKEAKFETGITQKYTVKNAVINITKKMPTSCPTFIWKTNQTELQALVPVKAASETDVYQVVVNNSDGTIKAKDGILNFNNMFVVADGSQINDDHSYVFKLAGSEINTAANGKPTVDLYRAWEKQYFYNGDDARNNNSAATDSYAALIANKFIDGKTSHALTTEYNYGEISSDEKKNPYKLSSSNYNLTYTTWSIQSADYMTYAWKKVDIDTSKDGVNMQPMNFINTTADEPAIKIANIVATPGQMINGDLRQTDLNAFVETKGYLKVVKVETKSNTNYSITNEYYTPNYANGTITFTLKNTGNTVPNHTAKVLITVQDCFGHKEVIELTAEFKAITGENAQLASN